jgi:hypothetical protein
VSGYRSPQPGGAGVRRGAGIPAAVGVFILVLLSLQVFLLTVGVDALLSGRPGLAWTSAGLSVLLALGAGAFYQYVR